jgi:Flp pilus assembly protein TadG
MGNEKGQALIELALVLLLLMIILFGIEEFGRFFFHLNTIKNAAREGVRQAIVTPNLSTSGPTTCSSAGAGTIAEFTCRRLGGLTSATVQVKVFDKGSDPATASTKGGAAVSGDIVQVKVSWDFQVIGLVPFFNDRTIVGNVIMRYE